MKIVVSSWDDPKEVRRVDDAEAALYDKAFVFPIEAEAEVLEIVNKRAAIKRQLVDSMALVYQLSNKLTREGRR